MDNIEEKNLTLDLSSTHKKKITVDNGETLQDLYLNLSDMNLPTRFKEKYEYLQDLEKNAFTKLGETGDDVLQTADTLKNIDNQMREVIDYIFDGNVSEVCASSGSMFDLIDGKFRYECILDGLSKLYDDNIKLETKKLEKRLSKHTDKYIKK